MKRQSKNQSLKKLRVEYKTKHHPSPGGAFYMVKVGHDPIMIAYAGSESLVAKIAVSQEIFGVEERIIVEWIRLIDYEQRLLNGVKKRDAEKYKKLPNTNSPSIPVSELK